MVESNSHRCLLGARGLRTSRPADELADGVILDSVATPDNRRSAPAEVCQRQTRHGWPQRRIHVVVYMEPPAGLPPDALPDLAGLPSALTTTAERLTKVVE